MKSLKFPAVVFLLLTACACGKDEKEDPASTDIVDYQFLNATSYKDWVYFSFEQGEIVTVTDFANDLSWDIAFHRGDIRLNGGASGKGQGAALNTRKTDWNAVRTAPASGYAVDGLGEVSIAPAIGSMPLTEEQPLSVTLADWMTMKIDPVNQNGPPEYSFNNWIFVVKTADGKYVKLWLYDYKDERNITGGWISFKYQISRDNGVF